MPEMDDRAFPDPPEPQYVTRGVPVWLAGPGLLLAAVALFLLGYGLGLPA